jgi:hypothetical protein
LISFRYHLVTIVSIFLALALGVLVGTTVVNQGIVSQLRRQTNTATSYSHTLQKQVNDLQQEVKALGRFGDEAAQHLIPGTLPGRGVVVVTAQDVDASEIFSVRAALRDAGAKVMGVLLVTPQMRLATHPLRVQLAELLQMAVTEPDTSLVQEAARRVARRLADGVDPAESSDILQDLIDGGFVAARDETDGIVGVGGPDQTVVVLSGGAGDPLIEAATFFMPLVTELVRVEQPVAAGETSTTSYPFVSLIRGSGDLDQKIVTVDNADTVLGRVGLILGIQTLLATGRGGDYGVKAGSLLPPPLPTSSPAPAA